MADATASKDASPLGLVLKGRRGSGKTHLLGWVRQQIQDQGGYFFLVSLLDAKGFWDSVLASMIEGLFRTVPGSDTQLRLFLRRLSSVVGAPRPARRAVMGETELTPAALDAFVRGLGEYDRLVARECDDTVRALALSASDDVGASRPRGELLQLGAGGRAGRARPVAHAAEAAHRAGDRPRAVQAARADRPDRDGRRPDRHADLAVVGGVA